MNECIFYVFVCLFVYLNHYPVFTNNWKVYGKVLAIYCHLFFIFFNLTDLNFTICIFFLQCAIIIFWNSMFLWVIQIWQSNALSYSTVLHYESTLTHLKFITVQYVLLARVLSILIILSLFKKYIPPTQKLVKSPVSLNQFNRWRSHGLWWRFEAYDALESFTNDHILKMNVC